MKPPAVAVPLALAQFRDAFAAGGELSRQAQELDEQIDHAARLVDETAQVIGEWIWQNLPDDRRKASKSYVTIDGEVYNFEVAHHDTHGCGNPDCDQPPRHYILIPCSPTVTIPTDFTISKV